MRSFGPPPTADEIEAIARQALANLPGQFAQSLGDVVLLVEEKSGLAQAAQTNVPRRCSSFSGLVPARSVPASRRMR